MKGPSQSCPLGVLDGLKAATVSKGGNNQYTALPPRPYSLKWQEKQARPGWLVFAFRCKSSPQKGQCDLVRKSWAAPSKLCLNDVGIIWFGFIFNGWVINLWKMLMMKRWKMTTGFLIAAVCRTHLTLVDLSRSRSGHGFPRHLAELPYLLVNCPRQKAGSPWMSVHVCVLTMTYIEGLRTNSKVS